MSISWQGTFALRIVLLHFVVPVARCNTDCVWLECTNKAISLTKVCNSGYTHTDTRDCGNDLFGVYTNEEKQCCPDANACAWYDASCNWNTLKDDIFEDGTDPELKDEWSNLPTWLREKLRTNEGFRTVNNSEIMDYIPFHLLGELKSVEGMSADQLKFIFSDLRENMTGMAFRDMMKNINASVFGQFDVIGNITSKGNWTQEQIERIQEKLAESWGDSSHWNTSNINSLHALISGFNKSMINSFDLHELLQADNFNELLPPQVVDLVDKFSDLNESNFEMLVHKLRNETFLHVMPNWTTGEHQWISGQVMAVIEKLEQAESWGNKSTWNASLIEKLGNMIPAIAPELLGKFNLTEIANPQIVEQLVAMQVESIFEKLQEMNDTTFSLILSGMNDTSFVELLHNLSNENFTQAIPQWGRFGRLWKTTKVRPIFAKLNNAWGNASTWNASSISELGELLIHFDEEMLQDFPMLELALSSNVHYMQAVQVVRLVDKFQELNDTNFETVITAFAGEAVAGAVPEWAKNETFNTNQVMVMYRKLQEVDAWGNATGWNATAISKFGPLISKMLPESIGDFNITELADSGELESLFPPQLAALWAKSKDLKNKTLFDNVLHGFNVTKFESFVESLNGSNLEDAVEEWGNSTMPWEEAKVMALFMRIQNSSAWGNTTSWNSQKFSKFGKLLSYVDPSEFEHFNLTELSLSNMRAMRALRSMQLANLWPKLEEMKDMDFETLVEGLADKAVGDAVVHWGSLNKTFDFEKVAFISHKLQSMGAWGNATTWNASRVSALGEMLSGLDLATLLNLDYDELANATNLRALKAVQLIGMKPHFLDMANSSFHEALAKFEIEELKEAIPEWGKGHAWVQNKASAIGAKLEEATMWGPATHWNASRVSSLGHLITGLSTETIDAIRDEMLTKADNLKNLTQTQVAGMAQKMKNMSKGDFESMVGNISQDAFTGAISSWGQESNWTSDQVETIVTALQDGGAWGTASTWTYDQAQSLGSMLDNLPTNVRAVVDTLTPPNTTTTAQVVTSTAPDSTTSADISVDGANRADVSMAAIMLAAVSIAGLSITSTL